MAPPVWTLVLLVGAAWGQGHMPQPVRKQKVPDGKPVARSSRDDSILTHCDFEDDSKPLCDWSQASTDDGDWTPASGPSLSGTGPPGGYPNGEGKYLHMDSDTFHQGEVARLRSPRIWEQGPLCVHFAYHMFGLSWGAQLRLLLLTGPKGKIPRLLWKHSNTQSPSWMPTAVTVPRRSTLPSQLIFEGRRGSTAYLDIALDAISVHRGFCNPICMMQMCDFDTPNDLCGWSWIPTASGAKWVQKQGSSGVQNVGPEEDFSSPGCGFYMLLDPKDAKPRQKCVLLSPLSRSSGCLTLSFHYTLYGQSPGAALMVYASVLGSIRKHTLFSGQPRPYWQSVSVSYTGQGQIQFAVVGVFGVVPEPAVAVDAIVIAPCGESFPECDFEDDARPFCNWAQASGNGGHWARGSKNQSLQGPGPFGASLNGESHYIYLQPGKFSQAGQSFRLMSRPFCTPGAICVELSYHMYGFGEGAKLRLLLESPAGSSPTSLWHCVGSQSPDWLNTSITIPSGRQQPIQLILEAIRGTNSAFVMAVGFIFINHGTCRGPAPTVLPSKSPVPLTGPSETPVFTGKHMATTEKPTVPSEISTIPTEKATVPTEKPTVATEKPIVPTEKPTVPTEKPTVPTEKPTVPTEKPTVPTEKPTVPTEKPTVPTEKPTVPTEKPTVPTEKPTVPTEKPTVPTEKPTVPTEKPTVPTEKPTVPTEKPTVPTEKPTVPTEKSTVPTEKPTVPTEKPTVPTEKPTVPTEKPTVPTEKPTVPTEKPTVPTEKPTVPTEKPTVPTEKPSIPTEKPTVPTEKPSIPTEKPTVPTERPTVPTEESTVPTERPTFPTERPTVPTERPTVPSERPTAPLTPQPSPTLVPTEPTVLAMPLGAPSMPMTAVTLASTEGPRPTPASCPPNAHYESCACPASCQSPKPTCEFVCQPGCVCNPGFLFNDSRCISASSCSCMYNNNYYKPGVEWFSPNCTERCRCWPGSRMECELSQCATHTVCQLKNGEYGCHPYGTATCFVYGDPHYLTFDGRHFGFMGKCTYILAQARGNLTEPFFRVTAKNEERGQEGVSCLSKVYVTLPDTTITLLKGRRTLVGGQQVTLPAIPSKGVFLAPSGRFVELQTAFGLRVRWDGDQQLFISVSSTYSGKLCGLCGNYDGDSSNDNQEPDGSPERDDEELGHSWQMVEDEDVECQKNQATPPSCTSALLNGLSGPEFCGRLADSHGTFEACLPHLGASPFFESCMFDLCNFQGLQLMLCAHMAALTETCQDAGYVVKPWRGPQFCPLACPPNSHYTLCAKVCPDTCHSGFSGMSCQDRCVEGCECNSGFVLSGLQCVPRSQCGCLTPGAGYFKIGQQWFKPGCRQLCICEGNNRIRCELWRCQPQEVCSLQGGIYGCHAQGTGTCTVSGDPHYLTFDGALHHFMGTCTYVLTQLCLVRSLENTFVVSATNEFRSGNLEASYVKAVHVQVFNLRISLIKGHKVVLDGRRVALPLWPAHGRVSIRPSGSFVLLYTDFGLQVRYDGNHLVEVTVPSTYAGRLCGLCGNYNNNSLDDILSPHKRPVGSSVQLGISWKSNEYSEPGCFVGGAGGQPSRCQEKEAADTWNKNCDILMNPVGPFSQCHEVVPPHSSFASCVYGQCGSKGDPLTLCRSLQAYASLCARAGRAPDWRNSTFCPLKCPSGSSYSRCANPCPVTCFSLTTPKDCPAALPCAEGCECQKGHVLSGVSCVPLSQCGCTDQWGSYHPVGESWFTDNTCSKLCTCSTHNISCLQTACKPSQMCWPLDGLMRCRAADMGVCRILEESNYVSFDGAYHALGSTCTYVLVKVCHSTMDLPFFKITGKNGEREGQTSTFYLRQLNVNIFGFLVTLQQGHRVLINGTQVSLPLTSQIRGVSITARGAYTVLSINIGVQVKFDGNGFLEIKLPRAYYEKVCGMCGNFNGEEEDELMMPSDELAENDTQFVDSWRDKESDPKCQQDEQTVTPTEQQEKPITDCRPADLVTAQKECEAAFHAPAWAECATRVIVKPLLLGCTYKLCEFGGLNHLLCEALQAFGAACEAQGLKPPIWRNSSFCPLECPTYSTFTTCVPACSPSCQDPEGWCKGTEVPATCKEGCVCQPGYVLSEQHCVPWSQCGCKDAQGGLLPVGKTWLSHGCTQRCVCKAGAIQCQPFTCPSGSHCQPDATSTDTCAPDKSEQCSVFGDPHYRTFDGLSYRFQGRMTYTLVKTVDVLPDGVEPLVVEGRNKMIPPFTSIFLHEILVMVYGYTIQLQTNLELVVNNQKMAIPYKVNEHLRVTMRSHRLYLITNFELVVSFDGRNNAVISLPSMYEGLVRGLCGNYDKNRRNEFMLPNGTLTQNLNTFGNSWEVKIKEDLARVSRAIPEEEDGEEELGFQVTECSPEQLELRNSTQACGVLVDPQGPFATCHQTVAPDPFHEHCVFDLCAAWDPRQREELRCQVLSGYAIICQEAGAALAGWRDHTHCALVCPANTVYQSCMTPCPASCANLAAPGDCEGPCVEGCASLPGYVYSGAWSLPLAHCGCTHNGIYYQRGDRFVTEDCSQRCICASSGVLLCEPFSCRAGEICTLGNFTRGCFRESPCLRNPCQNDGRCQEQGPHFTCECELGYGGDLCTEPWDVPPPEKPVFALVAILLGMLVPVIVVVPALTRECVSRKRRRRRKEETHSQNGDRLADADYVPRRAFKVTQF
ncbi:zonadhesin isoform X2 [Equus caballus]|uniref:zonadhesin isoform X2 n=1 Tax=Equus caballus TaxID=9796 RepID=UPI0038B3CA4B